MDNKRRSGWGRSLAVVAGTLLQALAHGAAPAGTPAGDVVPRELIVIYRHVAVVGRGQRVGLHRQWSNGRTPAAVAGVHAGLRAEVMRRFRIVPAEAIRLPEGTDLDAAIAAYAAQPDVAAVYPSRIYRATAHVPNDPHWSRLWGMRMIRADEAWEARPVTNADPVVVAVIDSGVLRNHPDLQDRLWTHPGEIPDNGLDDDGNGRVDDVCGWDFVQDDNDPTDQNGHGTHVAGTIAAVMDNAIGVAGVSPAVRIMPVRGLNAAGYGSSYGLASAIEYVALMPSVKLSNNSWGGSGDDPLISMMIDETLAAGQLFVAAAGNDSQNIDQYMSHPGGMPHANIISVASVNELDELSDFSNYGALNVDIAAPGGTSVPDTGDQILSTWHVSTGPIGLYNAISGTSMAAPHVAGAAAYLWALKPDATYQEIASLLYDGAVVKPGLIGMVAGGRRLDLMGAVNLMNFEPFHPSRFYGDPVAGFPLSDGGVAHSSLHSTWADDCTVDIVIEGTPGPWLTIVTAPSMLAPGASEPLELAIDENAPDFPTVPGLYSNVVSVTFTPTTGSPLTIKRVILFRHSQTYFLQSAPFEWVPPAANRLTLGQLTGQALPLPTNLTFNYYNRVYSNLYVRANGMILFDEPAVEPSLANATLPDALSGVAGVAPNWMPTDLSGGGVWAGSAEVDARPAYVVTWSNVAHVADSSARFDYQVVLFDVGSETCSEIRYAYRRAAQDAPLAGMGRASTVGLQSDGGFLAAHYTVNGAWRPAPGMEYDPCPGWVDGLPMDLADRQALRWTWGAREPETTPPTAVVTPRVVLADEIRYEIRFDEIVFDLTAADFTLDTTVPGLTIGPITGGGERYEVELIGATSPYGSIVLQVDAGTVYDLEGNLNALPEASAPRAIPYYRMHLSDDFERGAGNWKTSAHGGTTDFTDGCWEFGTPDAGVPGGPAAAFSGTNCWGTFLGGPDWMSEQGYPNGWFPGGSAFAMQAQLDSPRIHAGTHPAVSFQAYWSLGEATATLLAVPAASGSPVPIGTITGSSAGNWQPIRYRLPAALANRAFSFRILVTSPYGASGVGIYIDDVQLYSVDAPGVYFVECLPGTVPAPSGPAPLEVIAYNTHTADVTDVEGIFVSPVGGVTLSPGQRVPFGALTIGGLSTSTVACTTAPGPYASRSVPFQGSAFIRGVADRTSYLTLDLDAAITLAANMLVAKTGLAGVRDWLGRPLAGDGSDNAAGYQILWTGPNGTNDPPAADGTPGGDDRVLYSTGAGQPVERFGAVEVAADAGLFSRAFAHDLAAGSSVYARAWDGPTFEQSVAYGDSSIRLLAGTPGEVVDFGVWTVGRPIHPERDLNGDGIPDGYAVTHPAFGIDPRETPDPGADLLRVMGVAVCSRAGFRPIRVELHGGRVYILYINNNIAEQSGAVEVRDLSLNTLLQTVTVSAGAGQPLANVSGMAIDRLNGKLYVAEYTVNCRIHRFGIGADGLLAYEATSVHGRRPTDLAVDPEGQVYVADNQASIKRYPALLAGAPVAIPGVLFPEQIDRVSVFGDAIYATYLDATYQVHQVHRVDLIGWLEAVYGLPQQVPPLRGSGYLYAPAKVWEGVDGWLYVADRSNHRIQLFDADGGYLAMTPATEPTPSALPGAFDMPTAVAVTNDPFGDHVIFVADEKNNRVQRLAVLLDVDRDGMDDAWEIQHGLDPADPADALLDNDGDGLTNLGEYRLRRDPNDPDTDQDGLGDAFDLFEHAVYPIGATPAHVTNLVAVVATNGATVAVTVFFDKAEPLNAPVQLDLSGGAYLNDALLAMNGSVGTYTYVVQPGDAGWVTVAISGPFQDPPVYTAIDAFELADAPAPTTTLTTLTATPGLVGANTAVVVGATFSAPVSDAAVTIAAADGAPVVTGAAMTPSAPAPTDSWSYTHLPSPTATNRWFVVSLASSGLPGGTSPRRAGFAVIDPRITAFAMPPPAVTWSALTGVLYRIESRDDLLAGAWQTVLTTNRPGPVELGPLTAWPPDVPPVGRRFFRVVAP